MSKVDKEKLYILSLREVYGQLLTDKQRLMLNMFYDLDLSLAEIAQQQEVSRQAVLDCIHKAEDQLKYLETTLNIYDKRRRIEQICSACEEELSSSATARQLIEEIRSICE